MRNIFRRLFLMLLALWVIVTLTFFFMHLAPGNPFSDERALSKSVLESLNRHYHLDKPLLVQYYYYLKDCLSGNFGPSLSYAHSPVVEIIKNAFPLSLLLGLQALLLSSILGIALGALSALRHNSLTDFSLLSLTILGLSVPGFIIATLLQYFFALKWSLLPLGRFEGFSYSILPTLSLATLPTAFLTRLMRTNTLEVLQEDYILTAKAKGLSSPTIFLHHVLRNASIPLLAYLGPLFASIVTGSFVIEDLFHLPGLGRIFVHSVTNRDYPLIMGITIFYASLLLLSVFIIDLCYSWVDPRIRKKSSL